MLYTNQNEEYESLSDCELVSYAHRGDQQAFTALIRRYYRFAKSLSKTYFLPNGDSDDLEQEALIGLFKAIISFNDSYNSSFPAFARLCIDRQLITAVKTATRLKNTVLNKSKSLDLPVYEDSDQTLLQLIPSKEANPEELMIDSESSEQLWAEVHKILSPLQRQVLELRLEGRNYEEIATTLNRSQKAVDNAIQRIKKKTLIAQGQIKNHLG